MANQTLLSSQKKLSEQLLLLHEFHYSDLDMPYQSTGVRTNKGSRTPDTARDLRVLDAIAVALTTGNRGDVFAAAFDKDVDLCLVLAKNGPPTAEDIAAAEELISEITHPEVRQWNHIFPFLLKRCRANIDKRIRNLHKSLVDEELRQDFKETVECYSSRDFEEEFRLSTETLSQAIFRDSIPSSFSDALDFVVTELCTFTMDVLDEDVRRARVQLEDIVIFANLLRRSLFLQFLLDNRIRLHDDRRERVQKLKRRLDKVCQYAMGITHLIERWYGEGPLELCESVYDAVARGLDQPYLSQEVASVLDHRLPFIVSNWTQQRFVHARVHAEIRIILHLAPHSRHVQYAIGGSKRSCMYCTLWIEEYNRIFETKYMTSGSHGKPSADWALPGVACADAVRSNGKSVIDEALLRLVKVRLDDTLAWLRMENLRRTSDEHISSGESSNGEENTKDMAEMYGNRKERVKGGYY